MAQENNTIDSGTIIPWQLDPGTQHDDVSLFTWWRTRLGFNCISVPDRDLDLYGDLVARHQSDEYLALTFTIAGKPIEVTYQQLHDEVVMLHRRWAQVLLQPGKTLAIAARSPLTRMVAHLAALRSGLVPTILIPQGTTRLAREIAWLAPDHIFGDRDLVQSLPDEFRALSLPGEGVAKMEPTPCGSQPSDAPAIRFFDPYQPGPGGIRTLSNRVLFGHLLRDAILVLGLNRGSRFACFQKQSPFSPLAELAALFAGAHYVGLNADDDAGVQGPLFTQSFDVVHLPLSVAQRWQEVALDTAPSWARWFRDPLESLDFMAWDGIVRALKLEGVPSASLHWSRQSGTVTLGTPWDTTPHDFGIYPSTGVPWHLGDLVSPKSEAKQGFGRYCQLVATGEEIEVLPSPILLSAFGSSFRFLGTYPKGRSGVPFPKHLVMLALSTPDAWHAVIEQENPNNGDGVRYVLLAFMDPRPVQEIQIRLEREIGLDGVPDEIKIFKILPRFDDSGKPDQPWIQRNFLNGELERRSQLKVYQQLSAFKNALLHTKPLEIKNEESVISDTPQESS